MTAPDPPQPDLPPDSAPDSPLAGHAWFDALAPEHQVLAARATVLQEFPAGAFIARRGEPSRDWIGVDSGLIKLAVYTPDGAAAHSRACPRAAGAAKAA